MDCHVAARLALTVCVLQWRRLGTLPPIGYGSQRAVLLFKCAACAVVLAFAGMARSYRAGVACVTFAGVARSYRAGLACAAVAGVARSYRTGVAGAAVAGVARSYRAGLACAAIASVARSCGMRRCYSPRSAVSSISIRCCWPSISKNIKQRSSPFGML